MLRTARARPGQGAWLGKKPPADVRARGQRTSRRCRSVPITGLSAASHRCWDAEKGTAGAGLEPRAAPGQRCVSRARRGPTARPGSAAARFPYRKGLALCSS